MLCYSCFVKEGGRLEMWDVSHCDASIKKKCEKCALNGIFVREVKLSLKERQEKQ